MSACDCLSKANEALAPHNTRIEQIYSITGSRIGTRWPISTVQIQKGRGKPKAMGLVASFCPLCGVSMKDKGDESSAQGDGHE